MCSIFLLFIHFSQCVLTHDPARGLDPGLLSAQWKPSQAVGVSHWASMPGGAAHSLMMLLWGFPPTWVSLPTLHLISAFPLSVRFALHSKLHQIHGSFSTSLTSMLCYLSPFLCHPPYFFSSLSGTITPSVVAAKREQMLELLPTQCTKPPTAVLWILSLLLLHSHKEHRAATPAPALASTSHLQQGRVDRFTYADCNEGEKEQLESISLEQSMWILKTGKIEIDFFLTKISVMKKRTPVSHATCGSSFIHLKAIHWYYMVLNQYSKSLKRA